MKFVFIILATNFIRGTPQLVRDPSVLYKLHQTNSDEPYNIQSIKGTIYDETQKQLKPQLSNDTQNSRDAKIVLETKYPKYRIKYKTQKSQIKDEPIIRLETENAIIDFEKNDTVESQRQLIEFESMNILNSQNSTNLLDSFNEDSINKMINDDALNYVDHPEEDFIEDVDFTRITGDENINEETKMTRRIIADTYNLSPIIYDVENVPHSYRDDLENVNTNYVNDDIIQSNEKLEDPYKEEQREIETGIEKKCSESKDNENSERVADDEDKSDVFYENMKNNTPTKGTGISEMVKSRMMILRHPRVCYVCNSIQDPNCWSPNRKTSVKYCRRDHNSCMTKVFTHRGKPYILRDCTESCFSSSEAEIGTAYASCTICQNDLCNSSQNIKIQNFVLFIFSLINVIFFWYSK